MEQVEEDVDSVGQQKTLQSTSDEVLVVSFFDLDQFDPSSCQLIANNKFIQHVHFRMNGRVVILFPFSNELEFGTETLQCRGAT